MTYTEFKNKWIGKGVDYDGKYGFQCTDVYRMYVKEVLGVPQSPPVVGAKDIWDNYLTKYFTRIENTLTAVPKQGDVIIWSVGTYGHIGICDSANKDSFISFEQNWTHLDGTGVTELRTHQYKNVLGWLRPIINSDETMTDEQKRILDFIGTRTEGDVREAFGALSDQPNKDEQIRILNERISFYETKIKELESTIDVLNGRIEDYSKTIDDWQSDFRTANEQVTSLTEQLGTKSTDVSKYRKLYENYNNLTGWGLIIIGIKKLFIK